MTKISRRGLLGWVARLGLGGAFAALLPHSTPEAIAAPPEPPWAESWPPTAHAGKLVRCDEEPGYYTTGGMPVLWSGSRAGRIGDISVDNSFDPIIGGREVGVSGFRVSRELDPPDGLHVMELDLDRARNPDGKFRYAVVRFPPS